MVTTRFKVFLVEDEIVTREGIRDGVEWAAAGFEFAGEAPDGELALPLIEALQPDVLITDIKMPFMDGLELCRIVRQRLPGTKIVILSGHDEFRYAQEAVHLGATEYLLKPIGPREMIAVLHRLSNQLHRERELAAQLSALQEQAQSSRTLQRQRFLLQLVTGHVSAGEIHERAGDLDLDLPARAYAILLLRIVLPSAETEAYDEVLAAEGILNQLFASRHDLVMFEKGIEEFVLIVKGDDTASVAAAAGELAVLARHEVQSRTRCTLEIGQGQPCERLSALPRSFAEAAQLLHARGEQEIQRHEAPVTQHALLLHKAMEYIDAHSANPDLSLGSVAAVVGLSPSYFSAVFARELGQTFVEHLTNVRIQKAMQLLRTSPLSAAEIGYQVGYSNPRYFYSVFKKVAGQPPNEYKRQALG